MEAGDALMEQWQKAKFKLSSSSSSSSNDRHCHSASFITVGSFIVRQ